MSAAQPRRPLSGAGPVLRLAQRRALRGALLIWPLPALLAWGCAWALLLLLLRAGWSVFAAAGAGMLLALLLSFLGDSPWRRRFITLGFPLSVALAVWSAGDAAWVQSGATGGVLGTGAWWWLLGVGVLAVVYPVRRWQDAPWYPTPLGALKDLPVHVTWEPAVAPLDRPIDTAIDTPTHQPMLDAGCGTGAGLRALRLAFPQAALHGVEWSWPLVLWCRWRCPFAEVRQGDFWREDWSPYGLVYLFARPESMARAAAKAATEMRPGTWLVSLDFEATAWQARHHLQTEDGRSLWLYAMPLLSKEAAGDGPADTTDH
jgi:hypothetical protein